MIHDIHKRFECEIDFGFIPLTRLAIPQVGNHVYEIACLSATSFIIIVSRSILSSKAGSIPHLSWSSTVLFTFSINWYSWRSCSASFLHSVNNSGLVPLTHPRMSLFSSAGSTLRRGSVRWLKSEFAGVSKSLSGSMML